MKRIIAIIVAFCISFMFISIPAFAMTQLEYEQSYISFLDQLRKGEITFSEYSERQSALIDEYYNSNTIDGVINNTAQKIGSIGAGINNKIGSIAETASDSLSDVLQSSLNSILNKYVKTQQQSTTDTKGCGAMVKISAGDGSGRYYIFYCDYVEIDINKKILYIRNYSHRANFEYGSLREWDEKGSTSFTIDSSASSIPGYVGNVYPGYLEYYGDVRYSDGSKAPTNDEFVDVSFLDLDTHEDGTPVTDSELFSLLNEISEALELEFPDTSTIEGLLKSINARLGKIDSDDDGELLSQINTAILSLVNSDTKNDENTADILKTLTDIRDSLKSGGNGLTCEHEIAGTLYNVKPLDKNFLNNLFTDKTELKVEYEGKKYYLESCGCLCIDDKYYRCDMNYSGTADIDYDFNDVDIDVDTKLTSFNYVDMNLSTSQKRKLDNIVDMITTLVSKGIPYAAVNGGLTFYQDIIFSSHDPQDIEFKLNFFGTDYTFTILSKDFFNSEAAQALQIVKNFVCIVVCYAWLLAMRRKTASMLG